MDDPGVAEGLEGMCGRGVLFQKLSRRRATYRSIRRGVL
jgi:hypothetical protein